jgi:hypothetical protein
MGVWFEDRSFFRGRTLGYFRAVNRPIDHLFDLSLGGDQFVCETFHVGLGGVERALKEAIVDLLLLGVLVVAIEALLTDGEARDGTILSDEVGSKTHLIVDFGG